MTPSLAYVPASLEVGRLLFLAHRGDGPAARALPDAMQDAARRQADLIDALRRLDAAAAEAIRAELAAAITMEAVADRLRGDT